MTWKFPEYPDNWDELSRRVKKEDNYRCTQCGAKGNRYLKLHCHHKVSLSDGGTNDRDNLETLCEVCHVEKHPHMLNNPETKERYTFLKAIRELLRRKGS